jgi:DNA polymerase I
MLRVDAQLRERALASRMLLQVHDELIFEVAPGELDALRELVTDAMCGAFEMSIPLDVSFGTGQSWAEAGH